MARLDDDPDYPPTKHLEVLYGEVKGGLARQDGEAQRLRERAVTLVATSFVVLGLVVTAFARGPDTPTLRLSYSVASILIGVCLVAGMLASFSRDLLRAPEPEGVYDDYYDQPTNLMLAELAASVVDVHRRNRDSRIILWRSRLVTIQLLTVIGAGVALIVGIVLFELGAR
jgi:Mn2+/Fe2+ NRAMP family transporter